jgi:ArsR family transcriptional regulator
MLKEKLETLEQYEAMSEFLKALAHPLRLKIVDLLANGELCVKDLCSILDVPQPTISQNIGILKDANIICYRKEAQKTCYRIRDKRALEILKILKQSYIENCENKNSGE